MPIASDYKDMLSALSEAKAEFLVVGAYAVIAHTVPRYTKDIDIWVNPTAENAARVFAALADFGAPLEGISAEDFTDKGAYFQIGVEPVRIDLLMSMGGLEFDRVWARRHPFDFDGIAAHVPCLDDVIAAKRAAGRPQDLLDIEWLERAQNRRQAGSEEDT